jgi:transposase InsO family protein
LLIVRPETVIRWHRRGGRLFWRWKSSGPRGRPRLATEIRQLIAILARDNPRWGSERIRAEVLRLGITVSKRSIQRYRQRGPARPPRQTWRTFLANHRPQLWAADLCTVQTLTFKPRYVFVLIAHGRRERVHLAVTTHPSAAWVWRPRIEATPWGRHPDYLVRDRDRFYGSDFAARAKAMGVQTRLTPFRAPKANAIAERVVRTLRHEGLDHVRILNERHRRSVLDEYVAYDNAERPHPSLALEPPRPTSRAPALAGLIRSRPVSGVLHHAYQHAA